RWEAPLQDGPPAPPAVPDSTMVDVRDWDYGGRTWHSFLETAPQDTAGSNNWAVAGPLTAHGGALLAGDMHLGLSLPNTWYRARLSWPEDGGRRAVVGVTLPGTPALVAGSNGDVAWGFTNSYADQLDLVILETDSLDAARYRTPGGWMTMDTRVEVIAVAGGDPDTLLVRETIWGPVTGAALDGRPYALRWTAHDPAAVDLDLMDLETARTVDEAVAAATRAGIPPQNVVCADRDGRIAWTVCGLLPRRTGWDGRLPASWTDGTCGWDGWLEPAEHPRIIDPPEGRLWTANNRVAAGGDLELLGDGGYALGARARQIRDGLRDLDRPDERDMLALQLDDRALFMAEWRDLVLPVLEAREADLDSLQAAFLAEVRDRWEGRASASSVSYHLVRNFSWECVDAVYEVLTGPVRARDRSFSAKWLPFRHAVVWQLLTERPEHFLIVGCRDWDQVMLEAVRRTMTPATWDGRRLEDFTWGSRQVVHIGHPFTQLDRRLDRWLAAPKRALPGDSLMPRVQGNTSGASQRMVVSPGREAQGIFHMPGGQSGHPLSRWFLAGHEAWAQGWPTPLVPGPPAHRLELVPR
ncbi:MAG: penicillin acylase family protein, partial [Krumholzibacteria bacterium]|nr:penicillin acylase family protein [Candidatus Krumholzibacteria bacterium]